MPVKIGLPIHDFDIKNSDFDPFDPRYATSIGLIKYVGQNFENYNKTKQNSFIKKVKHFLKELINN